MRIIAGTLKGRGLATPGRDNRDIRPTSDRSREALFSILQGWPLGSFLDLFSGTGAVGIEAWSRGYAPVTCIDRDPKALDCIRKNALMADVRILRMDLSRGCSTLPGAYSVIFSDPPYGESSSLFDRLAPKLAPHLNQAGVLIWETDRRTGLNVPECLSLVDDRSYGAVRFRFFRTIRE